MARSEYPNAFGLGITAAPPRKTHISERDPVRMFTPGKVLGYRPMSKVLSIDCGLNFDLRIRSPTLSNFCTVSQSTTCPISQSRDTFTRLQSHYSICGTRSSVFTQSVQGGRKSRILVTGVIRTLRFGITS